MKREYLPKNIREITIFTYDHGRDINGNGTAHYTCCVDEEIILRSGRRREQVGYSGQNKAALYALEKLGYEMDLSNAGIDDWRGSATYKIKNL